MLQHRRGHPAVPQNVQPASQGVTISWHQPSKPSLRGRALAAVAAVALGTAVGVHVGTAGPAGGAAVEASDVGGPKTNPTIAIDARDDRILLAGSNSLLEGAERVYSSVDAGRTWQTATLTAPVRQLGAACSSDPGVA